jgi:hypothetical protein
MSPASIHRKFTIKTWLRTANFYCNSGEILENEYAVCMNYMYTHEGGIGLKVCSFSYIPNNFNNDSSDLYQLNRTQILLIVLLVMWQLVPIRKIILASSPVSLQLHQLPQKSKIGGSSGGQRVEGMGGVGIDERSVHQLALQLALLHSGLRSAVWCSIMLVDNSESLHNLIHNYTFPSLCQNQIMYALVFFLEKCSKVQTE